MEVGALVALAAVYVGSELAGVSKRWTILGVAANLVGYAVGVWRERRESWRDFGLRLDNLAGSALPVAAFTLLGIGVAIAWAALAGRPLWRPELVFLLPVYPLYGITQQVIFQGILHRRLLVLVERRWLTVLITAVAFASVHLGDWRLVALTAIAGAVWSLFFQRWPNCWALGLSHGILAALVYPLVLADNPLQRI